MNLNKHTIQSAIKGLKAKEFTSEDLTNDCYAQITRYDPKVKAFLALSRDQALVKAKRVKTIINELGADKAFEQFPLLGIPYACKDNFNTVGIETTASSNVLKGYIPTYESTVTQRLKDAGAILIGKTNMDAFAHGSSTETSDFFTSLNPWDITRVAGGSSGGSASAVATDMCIFSIGSETSGSIRGPAAWCSVTGLKPTYGRVSRYGVIAMASSTDSPGPMCKTIEDCAFVLNIIAGHDANDSTSSMLPSPKPSKKGIEGLKIGRPRSYFGLNLDPGVKQFVEQAVTQFQDLGATIVDIDLLDPKYAIAVYTIIQRSEVSSNLARFDGIRYGHTRTSFGFEAKKRMMLGAYTLSSGYYDQYYSKAQKVRSLIIDDFNSAFAHVDLIIGPVMPSVPPKVGDNSDNAMFGELMDVLANPSSIAGLPAVSIPCGFTNDLPVGVQLLGPMFSEEKIISAAYNYQQVTNFHKRKPTNYD